MVISDLLLIFKLGGLGNIMYQTLNKGKGCATRTLSVTYCVT